METVKELPRVVVIGGGTGTHTVLKGLRDHSSKITLSAIVTMADSGGSTGKLRDEFGFLPVGDVRLALLALARSDPHTNDVLRKLFLYRFDRGEGLSGHTFGNLLLVALTDILGSEEAAIEAAGKLLGVRGEVIPVTCDTTHLVAHYTNGQILKGEHEIDVAEGVSSAALIEKISLSPEAIAHPRAVEAIEKAHLIILGPGDLYTSILANCVVGGMREAFLRSRAKIVFIANLMSRRGQTNGMGTKEYINEITRYIGRPPDQVILNTRLFREDLVSLYKKEDEYPVIHNYSGEVRIVAGDLLATEDVILARGDILRRSLIRHDPYKLAHAIMGLL